MKPKRPVVIAHQPHAEALQVLHWHAQQLQCPVIRPQDLVKLEPQGIERSDGKVVQRARAVPQSSGWLQPTGKLLTSAVSTMHVQHCVLIRPQYVMLLTLGAPALLQNTHCTMLRCSVVRLQDAEAPGHSAPDASRATFQSSSSLCATFHALVCVARGGAAAVQKILMRREMAPSQALPFAAGCMFGTLLPYVILLEAKVSGAEIFGGQCPLLLQHLRATSTVCMSCRCRSQAANVGAASAGQCSSSYCLCQRAAGAGPRAHHTSQHHPRPGSHTAAWQTAGLPISFLIPKYEMENGNHTPPWHNAAHLLQCVHCLDTELIIT